MAFNLGLVGRQGILNVNKLTLLCTYR
jgi:hypothetical protein